MNYQRRRRLYSQNFLRDPELVKKLIRNSSIGKSDLVIDIGSGKGSLTRGLIKRAGKVIAVEIDEKLTFYLRENLRYAKNLEIINADFLKFNLPDYPYKVFANIPFNISANIVRKLTEDINFSEGSLVVQKEFARKIIGKPYDYKNSMMATLLKPWFDVSIYHKFSRHDFVPFPHVDSVMVHIKRLEKPFIPYFQQDNFSNFILFKYNRENIVDLEFDEIIRMFKEFQNTARVSQLEFIKSEAIKIIEAQNNVQKIHRSRLNKNWRKI